jgi:hypothetical protein
MDIRDVIIIMQTLPRKERKRDATWNGKEWMGWMGWMDGLTMLECLHLL